MTEKEKERLISSLDAFWKGRLQEEKKKLSLMIKRKLSLEIEILERAIKKGSLEVALSEIENIKNFLETL